MSIAPKKTATRPAESRDRALGRAARIVLDFCATYHYELRVHQGIDALLHLWIEPIEDPPHAKTRAAYSHFSGSDTTLALRAEAPKLDEAMSALAKLVKAGLKRYHDAYASKT